MTLIYYIISSYLSIIYSPSYLVHIISYSTSHCSQMRPKIHCTAHELMFNSIINFQFHTYNYLIEWITDKCWNTEKIKRQMQINILKMRFSSKYIYGRVLLPFIREIGVLHNKLHFNYLYIQNWYTNEHHCISKASIIIV